ncbi:MAG: DNA polymerase IV [Thermomicrobiales bacterium]
MQAEDSERWVIHADLDAFFAAVAVKERPELRGKPVIVGGSPEGRGVVTSATYEARAYGVRSAMPAAQAIRLCPQAIFTHVPGDSIRWHAERFREILHDFSPVVEVVSVDEAYLDTGDSRRLYGGGVELARLLKDRVQAELGLVVSIGAASNRLVAKIASDLGKPNGFTVVPHGNEASTLAPLPIERLPGIGPKSAVRLQEHGITTLGELAAAPERLIASIVGSYAGSLQARARGEYNKPVLSNRGERKSLGHGRTFSRDLHGLNELSEPLFKLCQRVGSELRAYRLVAGTVALKVRYTDFDTRSKQMSFPDPTDAHQDLYQATYELMSRMLAARGAPVRMIEVRVSGLHPATYQLDLFDATRQRLRRLNGALDQLESRHGRGIVRPAWIQREQGLGSRD